MAAAHREMAAITWTGATRSVNYLMFTCNMDSSSYLVTMKGSRA